MRALRMPVAGLGLLGVALVGAAACGGVQSAAPGRPDSPPKPVLAPSQRTAGPVPTPPPPATEGASTTPKGCAQGGIVCPSSKPFCCKSVDDVGDYDGHSECVATYDDCSSTEFACTRENRRCPSTKGIVPTGCADSDPKHQLVDASGESLPDCAPGRMCRCEFRFVRSEAYHQNEEEALRSYEESRNCTGIEDCERFCRRDLKDHPKLASSACDRLVDVTEGLVHGSSGASANTRRVALLGELCRWPLPEGGARTMQARSCNIAGWGSVFARDVGRDYSKAARLYRRGCDLGNEDACAGAEGVTCIVDTWSSQRRAPNLDRWCNYKLPAKYWTRRAYLPENPGQRLELDHCFQPLRTAGCTGANVGESEGIKLPVGQSMQSAYCCAGERP